MSKEETQRYLVVNMERFRWKNKPSQPKYVIVNIPDYRLDVMENGKSILNMKVVLAKAVIWITSIHLLTTLIA
jgi:murein L,D-transpeptidase YcbB/YkuD